MRIHSLEIAEKIALRIKDYSALGKAIDEKLDEQALFGEDYKLKFQHGTNQYSGDDSTVVSIKPGRLLQTIRLFSSHNT